MDKLFGSKEYKKLEKSLIKEGLIEHAKTLARVVAVEAENAIKRFAESINI